MDYLGRLGMNFDGFIEQTKNKTVPEDFYFDNFSEVKKLCEKIISLDDEYTFSSLDEMVVQNLNSVIKPGVQISVLASGGADSTFLLSLIAKHFPNNDLVAYFGKTANNSSEFEAVRMLCNELGARVSILTPSLAGLERQLALFYDVNDRYPNDIAQPLHNLIVSTIRSDNCSAIIVDGQYADTLMFANPQNMFFSWWQHTANNPIIKKVIRTLGLMNFISLRPGQSDLRDLLGAGFADEASLIAWICRIDPSVKVRDSLKALLHVYSSEVVMQVVFYKVLLHFREKDKYSLCPELISPFNDIKLMVDAWRRPKLYNSLFMRKIPIWTYIKAAHPDIAGLVKRRSFEAI